MATGISHFNGRSTLLRKLNLFRPMVGYMRPVFVFMGQNQSYWTSIEEDIVTNLKKSIPIRPPESVFEPMHHLTFAAQKTTAPALCVAACELVGGDRSQAMEAASAIHLMHAAAYTHEHLPLTDSTPRTVTKTTIQHKFNPNIELLTGDGIFPFGLELLARSVDVARNNPDKILRVIIEITRATGSQGMVTGQYHEFELQRMCNDADTIEYVCKKKEGELYACAAACGAILGGGGEEEIEKLRKFGLYLGTIQGILGRNKQGMEENLEKLKALALKELESIQGKKIELISSLVEPSLPAASMA